MYYFLIYQYTAHWSLLWGIIPIPSLIFIKPTANEVEGVYSDPYVRPSVRSFLRPSVRPSLPISNHYSSKTAEQNFMKLLRIVHYMMPYCTSYFKFLSAWFWGVPEQIKDFAIQNMGKRGYHFVSIAHSISSLFYDGLLIYKY